MGSKGKTSALPGGSRAVVIGAGVAGLFTARVLSEHFDEVVILDREAPPEDAAPRRGVPQGCHTHALTARGTQLVGGLFPGIVEDLRAAGAQIADAQGDAEWNLGPAPLARAFGGLPVVACSRPLLETAIRARTLALPNVRLLAPARVRGLSYDAAAGAVNGVRLVGAPGRDDEHVVARLVVDASGRASKLPDWLGALGYPPPEEESLPIEVGYASVVCRVSREAREGRLAVIVGGTPSCPRGGVAQVIEGERVMISLAGFADHAPTPTLEGMREHARSHPVQTLARWLERAEEVDVVTRYRVPRTYWRRYDRVRQRPAGVIAIGDAVCAFNPVYAQGMTVAAMQALALGECLARGHRGVERRFARRAARLIAPVWQMASGSDRAILEHSHARPYRPSLVDRWVERVQRVGSEDPVVARRFLRVTGLVDSPAALFSPRLVLRVLTHRPVDRPRLHAASSS